ncbi:MAG TPA: hypothetical protein VFM73_03980 [Xanthomonadaceae bacterium]|nr:hypothetical protein [Xanthomonadaceae bacterium]
MTSADQIKQDLDYVASAVRFHDRPAGVPGIYFLWACIVPVGFALPDFAPGQAGTYWLFASIGGGLLSWWLAERDARHCGILDAALGRRHGFHWLVGGVAFVLTALPLMAGRADPAMTVSTFLLVSGLLYALAGVHLDRGMLWSGLLMMAAYAVLVLFAPPYTWTITGVAIGLAMAWAGHTARRARVAAGCDESA